MTPRPSGPPLRPPPRPHRFTCLKTAIEENQTDAGGDVVRDRQTDAVQEATGRDPHAGENEKGTSLPCSGGTSPHPHPTSAHFCVSPAQFNTTSALSTPTSFMNSGLGGTLCQSAIQKPPLSASKVRSRSSRASSQGPPGPWVDGRRRQSSDTVVVGLSCRVLA